MCYLWNFAVDNTTFSYSDGLYKLKEEFKKLKMDLKVWKKDIFGYDNLQKYDVTNKISGLDKLDDESILKKVQRI